LFEVDTVIVCAGQTPLRTLYDELQAAGVKATLVGGAFEAVGAGRQARHRPGQPLAAVV
jgi:2,4-dienoyl-CoA reductase (NADPH2)